MVKLSTPRPVKAVVTGPSRNLDTVYQNTTGRPKIIIVAVDLARNATVNDYAYAIAYSDANNPPTTEIVSAKLLALPTGNQERGVSSIVFCVPHTYYYKVSSFVGGTSIVGLISWKEVEL